MRIGVVSLFPEMFEAVRNYGITSRAINSRRVQLEIFNPRDFTHDRHHTVDDRPYGGGPGMVMQYLPLQKAICAAKESIFNAMQLDAAEAVENGIQHVRPTVIYLSPQGKRLDHSGVEELTCKPSLILVAGRYEGIDERLIQDEVDEEWSIGDYVLSGGELPAMVLIDSICRLIPEVLGHADSAREDSFVDGLLDYPHYTRPEQIDNRRVPDVLLSGDHERIRLWRLKQALGRTWQRRPDLLKERDLTNEEQQLLDGFIEENT